MSDKNTGKKIKSKLQDLIEAFFQVRWRSSVIRTTMKIRLAFSQQSVIRNYKKRKRKQREKENQKQKAGTEPEVVVVKDTRTET